MSLPATPRASCFSNTPPQHRRRGDVDWVQLQQEARAEMEAEAARALRLAGVGLARRLLGAHVQVIIDFAQGPIFEEPAAAPAELPPMPVLNFAQLPLFVDAPPPLFLGDAEQAATVQEGDEEAEEGGEAAWETLFNFLRHRDAA